MFRENARFLPIVTIIMSVPLLLSYGFKHQLWPEGFFFGFMYFWLLISTLTVPVLLLIEIIITALIFKSEHTSNQRHLFKWHLLGLTIALVAELIWIIVAGGPFPEDLRMGRFLILPELMLNLIP